MNRHRHASLEPTQTELKQTQFACGAWINLPTRGFTVGEHPLAQFVTPERGDGHRQQQPFEAVGMLQARMLQIEAAGLIIAEALLNTHATAVLPQARATGSLIRY